MISNYSAYERDYKSKKGKERYFQGEENGVKFKIVCPKCKSEGRDLEYKNWYSSKESGEHLIIKCKNCGNEIDTETEDRTKCCVEIKNA